MFVLKMDSITGIPLIRGFVTLNVDRL